YIFFRIGLEPDPEVERVIAHKEADESRLKKDLGVAYARAVEGGGRRQEEVSSEKQKTRDLWEQEKKRWKKIKDVQDELNQNSDWSKYGWDDAIKENIRVLLIGKFSNFTNENIQIIMREILLYGKSGQEAYGELDEYLNSDPPMPP